MLFNNKFKSVAVNLYNYLNTMHNYNVTKVAEIVKISKSTLYNWIDLHKKNPEIFHATKYGSESEPKRSKSSKITTTISNYICDYVLKKIFFDVKLLIRNNKRNFHIRISRSYIYLILGKNKVTHKRLQHKVITKQYSSEDKFLELSNNLSNIDLDALISIDESSIIIGQKPGYGWSYKGSHVSVNLLPNQKRYSLILAINRSKVINYKLIEGSVNGEVFMEYLVKDIIPNSDNGSILMDNARIHHYKKMKQTLAEKDMQNKIIYNIPYHPEYNPIEYVFKVIKQKINKVKINNYLDLVQCLDKEFCRLNKSGFETYFDHCYKLLKIKGLKELPI